MKGGPVHGATGEVGYKVMENPHYATGLQAAVLRRMGLDYKKMSVVVNGRPLHMIEKGTGRFRGFWDRGFALKGVEVEARVFFEKLISWEPTVRS